MPIYEYDCPLGHKTAIIVKTYANLRVIDCPGYSNALFGLDELFEKQEALNGRCSEKADKSWSRPSNIQIGKPTIVFINPSTGAAQIATSEYEEPPKGFIKEELKGPVERSKFENQQAKLAEMDDLIFNEDIRQKREEFKDNHLKLIDQHLREDAQSSDNPELTVKLMKAAKDRIKKKSALPKKRKTQFRLDVNHIDKSNLD